MDEQVVIATRQAWHAVAELVIAGPQFREHGTIRLAATPGGFGGAVSPVRVDGAQLVWPGGRVELTGTCAGLAAAVGVAVGASGNYADGSGLDPDSPLTADPAAAAELADWFGRGDAVLRAFAPEITPILWPEHFDLAVAIDEVNYGVALGDGDHQRPYAYVGPWTPPAQGGFWNAPFGALRSIDDLPDAAAVVEFFAEGRAAAAGLGTAG